MTLSSPNLSEIVSTTLRNRSKSLAEKLAAHNAFLERLKWEPQEPGTVSLPDFIRLRAEGKAKMVNGRVFISKERLPGLP